MTQAIVSAKSDEEILDILKACDNLANPLDRRFEGDDDAIVNFMHEIGLPQGIVHKLLAETIVMREAISRGLQFAKSN